jgi:hypothetical protein
MHAYASFSDQAAVLAHQCPPNPNPNPKPNPNPVLTLTVKHEDFF